MVMRAWSWPTSMATACPISPPRTTSTTPSSVLLNQTSFLTMELQDGDGNVLATGTDRRRQS